MKNCRNVLNIAPNDLKFLEKLFLRLFDILKCSSNHSPVSHHYQVLFKKKFQLRMKESKITHNLFQANFDNIAFLRVFNHRN
jgi:hypothetical protein